MIRESNVKCPAILSMILMLPCWSVYAAELTVKVIGFSCNTCHSTDSQQVKHGMIELKSRPADALTKKLLDFKYDRQASSIMGRIAKGYSDAELQAVAHYYSQLQ